MIIFSDSRDPNRVPKMPLKKPCCRWKSFQPHKRNIQC